MMRNKINSHIIGSDAEENVEQAFLSSNLGLQFTLGNSEYLPSDENLFSVISSFHNIEHFYYPQKFISCAHTCLKANGYLFLACPNPSSCAAFWEGPNWQGFVTKDYVSLKAPYEYRKMFERNGFELIIYCTTLFSSLSILKSINFLVPLVKSFYICVVVS